LEFRNATVLSTMGPLTRTICPFPYTWPAELNGSSVSECTITYAEALGASYLVIQILALLVAIFGITMWIYRLWKLKKYTEAKQLKFTNHPTLVFFIICLLFNLVYFIENFDIFGFAARYPPELFVILDEVVASLALSNGVTAVAFYYRVAKGAHDKDKRTSLRVRNMTVTAVWCNFVGFITLAVCDPSSYYLYDGLKCIVGATILAGFVMVSTYYVIRLRRSIIATIVISANKERSRDQLKSIMRKHYGFVFVLSLSSICLYASAGLSLSRSDYAWSWVFVEQPEINIYIFRIVFALNTFLTLWFFKVPRLDDAVSYQVHSSGQTPVGRSPANGSVLVASGGNPLAAYHIAGESNEAGSTISVHTKSKLNNESTTHGDKDDAMSTSQTQ
jgi:hypothetical protein